MVEPIALEPVEADFSTIVARCPRAKLNLQHMDRQGYQGLKIASGSYNWQNPPAVVVRYAGLADCLYGAKPTDRSSDIVKIITNASFGELQWDDRAGGPSWEQGYAKNNAAETIGEKARALAEAAPSDIDHIALTDSLFCEAILCSLASGELPVAAQLAQQVSPEKMQALRDLGLINRTKTAYAKDNYLARSIPELESLFNPGG